MWTIFMELLYLELEADRQTDRRRVQSVVGVTKRGPIIIAVVYTNMYIL